MDTSIELRYAGVVIGKATVAGEIDEGGLFLPVPDPLPVGTKVTLKIDDRPVDGRVISVSESADPAKCGMKIRIGAAAPAVSAPAPASPVAAASAESTAAEAAGAVGAVVDAASDLSTAQTDGSGEGAPGAEDSSGQSGGSGGRRKKRRR